MAGDDPFRGIVVDVLLSLQTLSKNIDRKTQDIIDDKDYKEFFNSPDNVTAIAEKVYRICSFVVKSADKIRGSVKCALHARLRGFEAPQRDDPSTDKLTQSSTLSSSEERKKTENTEAVHGKKRKSETHCSKSQSTNHIQHASDDESCRSREKIKVSSSDVADKDPEDKCRKGSKKKAHRSNSLSNEDEKPSCHDESFGIISGDCTNNCEDVGSEAVDKSECVGESDGGGDRAGEKDVRKNKIKKRKKNKKNESEEKAVINVDVDSDAVKKNTQNFVPEISAVNRKISEKNDNALNEVFDSESGNRDTSDKKDNWDGELKNDVDCDKSEELPEDRIRDERVTPAENISEAFKRLGVNVPSGVDYKQFVPCTVCLEKNDNLHISNAKSRNHPSKKDKNKYREVIHPTDSDNRRSPDSVLGGDNLSPSPTFNISPAYDPPETELEHPSACNTTDNENKTDKISDGDKTADAESASRPLLSCVKLSKLLASPGPPLLINKPKTVNFLDSPIIISSSPDVRTKTPIKPVPDKPKTNKNSAEKPAPDKEKFKLNSAEKNISSRRNVEKKPAGKKRRRIIYASTSSETESSSDERKKCLESNHAAEKTSPNIEEDDEIKKNILLGLLIPCVNLVRLPSSAAGMCALLGMDTDEQRAAAKALLASSSSDDHECDQHSSDSSLSLGDNSKKKNKRSTKKRPKAGSDSGSDDQRSKKKERTSDAEILEVRSPTYFEDDSDLFLFWEM